MNAILLAAGFGIRLRPITDTTPKCLVAINGKPLLQIWLERLSRAGLGPFLVNTHYLASQVETFVACSSYHHEITIVHEPALLGTAATLIENVDFFRGCDGMLIHADNYCMQDFSAFVSAHHNRPQGCLMTMMTFRTDKPSCCGIVDVDERGVVTGFYEKVSNPPGNLANGAVYILSSHLLEALKSEFNQAKDFSTEVLPKLVGKIFAFETSSALIDIGTADGYMNAVTHDAKK